jgi:hypothetical protein
MEKQSMRALLVKLGVLLVFAVSLLMVHGARASHEMNCDSCFNESYCMWDTYNDQQHFMCVENCRQSKENQDAYCESHKTEQEQNLEFFCTDQNGEVDQNCVAQRMQDITYEYQTCKDRSEEQQENCDNYCDELYLYADNCFCYYESCAHGCCK